MVNVHIISYYRLQHIIIVIYNIYSIYILYINVVSLIVCNHNCIMNCSAGCPGRLSLFGLSLFHLTLCLLLSLVDERLNERLKKLRYGQYTFITCSNYIPGNYFFVICYSYIPNHSQVFNHCFIVVHSGLSFVLRMFISLYLCFLVGLFMFSLWAFPLHQRHVCVPFVLCILIFTQLSLPTRQHL